MVIAKAAAGVTASSFVKVGVAVDVGVVVNASVSSFVVVNVGVMV
jgi:hypothetical protein